MTATIIVVGILVLGAVLGALLIWRSARGRRGTVQDVPPGLRPAYSDAELEQSVQYRYRAWGMVLFVFFALFLPIYWFFESQRLNAVTEGTFVQSVVRGELLYEPNCSECHGRDGGGGAATSPYGDDSWPAPNLTNIAARYEDNANITDIRDYIYTTIERGRPGTPMPTWGAAYGGPLTDQQIEEITDWILAQQTGEAEEAQNVSATGEELYTANCVRCHGEDGDGLYVPEEGNPETRPGASLIGVFERHNEETILGILRNGIYVNPGMTMPPWQNGYMYPDASAPQGESRPARWVDEDLQAIIEHLKTLQPEELPPGADIYQAPGTGPPGPEEPDDATTTTALRDEARG